MERVLRNSIIKTRELEIVVAGDVRRLSFMSQNWCSGRLHHTSEPSLRLLKGQEASEPGQPRVLCTLNCCMNYTCHTNMTIRFVVILNSPRLESNQTVKCVNLLLAFSFLLQILIRVLNPLKRISVI